MAPSKSSSRLAPFLLFGLLALLIQGSNSQRRQEGDGTIGRPSNSRPSIGRQETWPGAGGSRPGGSRPGGSRPGNGQGGGEFWPGTGGSGSSPGGNGQGGGEFWPGTGGGSGGRPTTRRPSSGGSGCSCPTTTEYNPVCGTDAVSYSNPGKLNCARTCGKNVSILHYGNCTPADPNAPTTTSTTTRRPRG